MQLRKKITLSVASLFAAVSPALAENINGYGPKLRISVNPNGHFGFIRSLFLLLFRPYQFYLK